MPVDEALHGKFYEADCYIVLKVSPEIMTTLSLHMLTANNTTNATAAIITGNAFDKSHPWS